MQVSCVGQCRLAWAPGLSRPFAPFLNPGGEWLGALATRQERLRENWTLQCQNSSASRTPGLGGVRHSPRPGICGSGSGASGRNSKTPARHAEKQLSAPAAGEGTFCAGRYGLCCPGPHGGRSTEQSEWSVTQEQARLAQPPALQGAGAGVWQGLGGPEEEDLHRGVWVASLEVALALGLERLLSGEKRAKMRPTGRLGGDLSPLFPDCIETTTCPCLQVPQGQPCVRPPLATCLVRRHSSCCGEGGLCVEPSVYHVKAGLEERPCGPHEEELWGGRARHVPRSPG